MSKDLRNKKWFRVASIVYGCLSMIFMACCGLWLTTKGGYAPFVFSILCLMSLPVSLLTVILAIRWKSA